MTTKNRSIQTDDIVTKLLAQIADTLKEAVGEGRRLGMADAVRRLAEGTKGMDAANFTGTPKRDKTPKGTVQCPVPNCNRPGIRPQSNFCKHHVETLDAEKREKLRAKQVEARKKDKEKQRELEIAARRAEASPQQDSAAA